MTNLRNLLGGIVASMLLTPHGATARESPAFWSSIQREISALQPPKLVWREIKWNYCLLDGLRASLEQKKPILLWAFINADPAAERC